MEKNVALALVLGGPHPRPTPLVPYGAVADTIAMVQTEQTMDITGGGGPSGAPTTGDSEGGGLKEWSPLGSPPYYSNSMVEEEDMVKYSVPRGPNPARSKRGCRYSSARSSSSSSSSKSGLVMSGVSGHDNSRRSGG